MQPVTDVVRWLNRLIAVRRGVIHGRGFHVGPHSLVKTHGGLEIGDDVYIGRHCTISITGSIGSGTLIANNVGVIGRYDHDIRCIGRTARRSPWIGGPDYADERGHSRTTIGADVWIGFGAIVLSGTTIGQGAVVGAGAVVVSDVAPYAIVVGNPARQVGSRFTEQQIAHHEEAIASRGA
jgi:acetyltransferase-like isoleucine patch superfamily enzyme